MVSRGETANDALSLGLALTIPGVLNVLLFRDHAVGHEFWTYYATPGIVVLAAVAACRLPRTPLLLIGFLALTIVLATLQVHRRFEAWQTTEYRDVAAEIDALVGEDDSFLVCDGRFRRVTYYMKHRLIAGDFAVKDLMDIRGLKLAGRIPNPLVFVVTPATPPPEIPAFEAQLAAFGTVERVDPDVVAARLPVTATIICPGPIWLVRSR